MGSIRFSPGTLLPYISEVVGQKSGLALTAEQIIDKLRDTDYPELLIESDLEMTRVRSEELQEIVLELLYRLGNIPSPIDDFPPQALFRKYKDDPEKIALAEKVIKMLIEEGSNFDPQNPKIYIDKVVKALGPRGGLMGIELLEETNAHFHRNIFTRVKVVEWKDVK